MVAPPVVDRGRGRLLPDRDSPPSAIGAKAGAPSPLGRGQDGAKERRYPVVTVGGTPSHAAGTEPPMGVAPDAPASPKAKSVPSASTT